MLMCVDRIMLLRKAGYLGLCSSSNSWDNRMYCLSVIFESIMLHSILLGEEIWSLFPERYMCLEADEHSLLQDKHFELRVLFCSNNEHLNGELFFLCGPWYVLLFMMIGMTDAGWFSCHWSDDVFNIEILFYKTSKAFLLDKRDIVGLSSLSSRDMSSRKVQ
jgi:hypothetical protein